MPRSGKEHPATALAVSVGPSNNVAWTEVHFCSGEHFDPHKKTNIVATRYVSRTKTYQKCVGPTFRGHSKTFYFQSAYPLQLPTSPRTSLSMRPDSSKNLALYKLFTYLLTVPLIALREITALLKHSGWIWRPL